MRGVLKLLGASLLCIPLVSWGIEGVGLDRTRVLIENSENEAQLGVLNSLSTPVLVYTSFLDVNGNPVNTFTAVPPIYRMEAKKNNRIRIVRVADLPGDRESVYWVNVVTVPGGEFKSNQLKILQGQRIKIFYRPKSINASCHSAAEALRWTIRNNVLKVENPSPVSVSMTQMKIDGSTFKAKMLLPYQHHEWDITGIKPKASEFKFYHVNEHGALQIKSVQWSEVLKR